MSRHPEHRRFCERDPEAGAGPLPPRDLGVCLGSCLRALARKHCVPLRGAGLGQPAVETRPDKDASLHNGCVLSVSLFFK